MTKKELLKKILLLAEALDLAMKEGEKQITEVYNRLERLEENVFSEKEGK